MAVSDNVCKKCLLREMAEAVDLAAAVREYRERLPDGIRTPEEPYEARLTRCKACTELSSATCMQCGCYVEIRAARVDVDCPMGYWPELQNT